MLIRIPPIQSRRESDVTPESRFLSRRELLGVSMLYAASACYSKVTADTRYPDVEPGATPGWLSSQIARGFKVQELAGGESVTPFGDASRHNNFYEFGTAKSDPARYAGALKTEPWSVVIDGFVERPGTYPLEELVRPQQLVERIYRLRCVEGWSMVIPWLGFPLAQLLHLVKPTVDANYVRFETIVAPEQMAGVRSGFSLIEWPYVEGLRLDEALHPLTFLAVGMYGRVLPNQNGAPLRLVVPWKYGFKSIKSIARISLVKERPLTTWEQIAPEEYGFYANVNPEVDHPRWSQAFERRLPGSLLRPNVIPTQLFNGYAEVAELYAGMDLRRDY